LIIVIFVNMKKFITILATTLLLGINAGAIQIVHGPYLQNVSSDEATFVWISDSLSVGWIEIAPDDNSHFYHQERDQHYDVKNGILTESRIHKVCVKGLKPGTTYCYRAFAKEVTEHRGNYVQYGRITGTVVYHHEPLRFKTLDDSAKGVNFFMVNDIHGNPEKLETLVGHVDLKKQDMALFVGDMVSVFENEDQVFSGFMDKATELFAAELPMYYTRGNHETRGKMAYDFQNYFSPFSSHIYYTYRQGPVCFIALDSGEDKPDSDIEYYGLTRYDQYRDEQVEWLKKVVASEEFKSAPFKVVTCHIPPRGGWHGNAEVASKFIPILQEAGIDIMLSGHIHKYIHYKAGECASFPVIVNSNDTVLKAEINENSLKIEVVDLEGKTVDKFSL